MKKIFNPCDECEYSYSKQNQDSGMCKICEFKKMLELEKRVQTVYGKCDGLLEKVVENLERHEGIDFPEPVFKARLLTDGEVDRWEEYKHLEERRKLLKLPCAVGDVVWDNDWGRPCSFEVTGFSFGYLNDGFEKEKTLDQVLVYYTNSIGSITGTFAVSEIGKTVFLTREEAEAALK